MRSTVATLLALLCHAGIARGEGDIDLVGYESDRFDLSLDSATLGSASNTISAGDFIDPRQLEFTGWSYDVDLVLVDLGGIGTGSADYLGGVELTLGNENDQGAGLRGRLWTFGGEIDTYSYGRNSFGRYGRVNDTADLAVGVFNLDYYQRVWAGQTSINFFVGPQLGGLWYEESAGSRDAAAIGFGLGVEMRRTIARTEAGEFAVLGHARRGYMWGETTSTYWWNGESRTGNFNTIDYGVGVEWRRQLDSGELVVQGSYGVRWLYTDVISDLSMTTAGVSVGYQW